MAYKANIPQPTDLLDASQVDILGNFQSANTSQSINHYPFDDGTTKNGKHKFVEMPVLAVLPTNIANEGSLYTKTISAVSELFYTPDTSLNEYQMTRTINAKFSNFSTNLAYGSPPVGFTQTGGWTFLPGGMLLQYGTYSNTGALGSTGTIEFPVTFTNPPYSVSVSLIRSASANQSVSLPNIIATNNQFIFQSSSSASDGVYWMAIGV